MAISTWYDNKNAHILKALCTVSSVIHILLLSTCPESPTYLYIIKGDRRRSENGNVLYIVSFTLHV